MNTQHPIAIGTQVIVNRVTYNEAGKIAHPQGAVGVVMKPLDGDGFLVRFVDGFESAVSRTSLMIRKLSTNHADKSAADLNQYVIYRCVVGSRAYGLHNEQSDLDLRGIYLPPAELHWSLHLPPEQLIAEQGDEVYWELQKFITLALKANPNILECLYTPLVEYATPFAEKLRDNRHIFLSKLLYQTYNGYALSQFKKLQKDMQNHGEIRWKHALHLIRLLLICEKALLEGDLSIQLPEHRDALWAIKRGEMAWEEVNEWRLALHKRVDDAFMKSTLPEQPDYALANDLLVEARRSAVDL